MRSSYKRIGGYIQLVDERNCDLSIETLLGLSIDKIFIPSVPSPIPKVFIPARVWTRACSRDMARGS